MTRVGIAQKVSKSASGRKNKSALRSGRVFYELSIIENKAATQNGHLSRLQLHLVYVTSTAKNRQEVPVQKIVKSPISDT